MIQDTAASATFRPMAATPSGTTSFTAPPSPGEDSSARAEECLAAMARREASALDQLYRLWAAPLLGLAMNILHDRTEAEECLQDAFVRMWRKAGDFDPARGQPFVWAFGILRGLCLDRLRYRTRLKRGSGIAGGTPLSKEPSAAPAVLAADDLARVQQFMARLEPAERECIQLAVLMEYTHTEIAERLGTPLGTVKNRLRRALTKLRTLFHDEI